ncbi:5-oxoprolinase subunit PxpA [Parapedobacter deserti]|uniref:5-oxoprolinase subunit A n=1 Tax=Parapedobacter deserti TaxID=1912957 RepID=A0ABV7JNQ7_9SPHI
MHTIDINCDMGEGLGPNNGQGLDVALMDYVSSINIACGFHAGSPAIMQDTVQAAVRRGIAIGAHPGLPDRGSFGRRPQPITPQEAYRVTLYQIGALHAFVKAEGLALNHVKPHGALYNMAAVDRKLAEAIVQTIVDFDPRLVLYGLSGSELIHAAQRAGIAVANEVFADRTYQSDGSLTPRGHAGSIIGNEAAAIAQVTSLVFHHQAISADGTPVSLTAETLCIHSDSPYALSFAKAVHTYLQRAQVKIQPTTR